MNYKQIEERKKYLALQAFYLKLKQLIRELEEKYPDLVFNGSIKESKK